MFRNRGLSGSSQEKDIFTPGSHFLHTKLTIRYLFVKKVCSMCGSCEALLPGIPYSLASLYYGGKLKR